MEIFALRRILTSGSGTTTSRHFQTLDNITNYDSFIWTEEYRGRGEFKLILPLGSEHIEHLRMGNYIRHSESDRIMRILKIETGIDKDGNATMELSGPSMEKLLYDRLVVSTNRDLRNVRRYSQWTSSARTTPLFTIQRLVTQTLISPSINPDLRALQGAGLTSYTASPYNQGTYEQSPNRFPIGEVIYKVEPGILGEALEEIAGSDGVGYGIVHIPDKVDFGFVTFFERDLSDQVVLSRDLDTVSSVRTVWDFTDHKTRLMVTTTGPDFPNYATAISLGSSDLVRFPGLLTTIGEDLNARWDIQSMDKESFIRDVETYNEAADTEEIGYGSTTYPRAMSVLYGTPARNKAAQDKRLLADAQVENACRYRYNVDYRLSDIVSFKDARDETFKARVIAYTFASDTEGSRGFPTLELVY